MFAKAKEILGLGPDVSTWAKVVEMDHTDCCGGTDLLVKFQFENGKSRRFIVSQKMFLSLKVGVEGQLLYNGLNFKKFDTRCAS